jgi:hypothetical protein
MPYIIESPSSSIPDDVPEKERSGDEPNPAGRPPKRTDVRPSKDVRPNKHSPTPQLSDCT